ncbi:MAG: GNAT family N-acetyltransferase [Deltaproteobacteria bacterium]|nr:GNAT family N-acetyltransferase [Deltaproteobacteria bacterium]
MLRAVEYPDARHLDPAWERARPAGQNVAMPGFLRAYETGGIEGVTLRYLGVYDGARFLGGAAFSQVAFGLDLMAPKAIRAGAAHVRGFWPGFARLRSTTCGVWAGQGGNEAVIADPATADAVIDRLAARAEALAQSAGSNVVVFKEFRTEETTVWDRLRRHGYLRLHSLPFASMEIRWRTFGEYLQALRSGYRRQARANLARRDLPGVTLDLGARIEDHVDEFHLLYLQVMDHTDFHIETLTPAFFRALGRELGPACRLVAMRRNGDLLGGALWALDRDHLTFLYAGFDYARLREHDTYFILPYSLPAAGIAAGVKVLDFGQLSSDAKTRMGARLGEVFAYAKGRGFPVAPVVTHLGNRLYPPHPMPVRHVFK